MTRWADYSGGRPSGAALKAAGFSGAIRYIGLGAAGKRLTAAEYKDLAATFGAANVALVAELGTSDSWGSSTDDDHARGVANASAALADARACGVPDTAIILAASDAHASAQWQITDTVAYVRGFRDVLGLPRTGHYGFVETQQAVHAAGVANVYWRCGSAPSAADALWVDIWQRNSAPTTVYVAGIPCDVNEIYRIPIQEADMPLTDADAQLVANHVWRDAIWSGKNTDGSTWLMSPSQVLAKLDGENTALAAQVTALSTALAKVASSPDITPAALQTMLDQAVAQHIAITGTVQIAGK